LSGGVVSEVLFFSKNIYYFDFSKFKFYCCTFYY